MDKFTTLTSIIAPLDRANIDTDLLKVFLRLDTKLYLK
jgi:3-isopropylmalate dehydratase small subunit